MLRFKLLLIILLSALVVVSIGLGGAIASRTIQAIRIRPTEAPILNGRLDDAVWGRASPADAFRQREPRVGKECGERRNFCKQ